jgi:hypothetical protein
MDTEPTDTLGASLVLEDRLPLRWEAVVEEAEPAVLLHDRRSNEATLRLIFGLDEHRPEIAEDDSAVAQELARLDFKVNLLLDLVGDLVARQLDLPGELAVRISAREIQWVDAKAPAVGQKCRLHVYLDLRYPRPLTLRGRVVGVEPAPPERHRITLEFDDPGEPVQTWLEKLIFRHHRRGIAEARRSVSSPRD